MTDRDQMRSLRSMALRVYRACDIIQYAAPMARTMAKTTGVIQPSETRNQSKVFWQKWPMAKKKSCMWLCT